MRSFVSLVVVGLLSVIAAASAHAQSPRSPFDFLNPPPAAPTADAAVLDAAGLKAMLTELGYQPEQMGVTGGYVAFKITLQHADGTRTHMLAIDPATRNIVLLGGGFTHNPDVKKAGSEWYRRLAKINNATSPRTIFINDSDVLGMTSLLANVNVTSSDLAKLIKEHLAAFDTNLVPLARELPSTTPVASK